MCARHLSIIAQQYATVELAERREGRGAHPNHEVFVGIAVLELANVAAPIGRMDRVDECYSF